MIEPLDMLLECHSRIRRFSAGLLRLAKTRSPGGGARDGAQDGLRYFKQALLLHAEDEDRSLAPRLRALGVSAEVEAALAQMRSEHTRIETANAEAVRVLEAMVSAPEEGWPALAAELEVVGPPFVALLAAHLELEERVVLPEVGRLPVEQRQAMVAEMYSRRGVRVPE